MANTNLSSSVGDGFCLFLELFAPSFFGSR